MLVHGYSPLIPRKLNFNVYKEPYTDLVSDDRNCLHYKYSVPVALDLYHHIKLLSIHL